MNTATVPATQPNTAQQPTASDSNTRLFAITAGVSCLTGLGLGAAVGSLFLIPSPDTGWLILGALVAVIVATATYLVTAIAITRRFRPAGERAGHIAAHVGFLIMLSYVVPLLSWLF